ncbi:MAG: tRNA 2-methylthio-N6-isopentenyl adenosine(37) hydroxylase MiaE, partial [Saprospiraceae bacterium]|nr:tRNA 2-methylthio-N6-isopentenyl adenosine(37) hydroxylase MiaE [Saprospiraceae bacterium]
TYVNALLNFQKKGGSRDDRLLEKLLTCALIEARSCERFRLLSLYISEKSLRSFYHQFMVSEAGHYRLFLELARLYATMDVANERWNQYLQEEVRILTSMNPRGDRMH